MKGSLHTDEFMGAIVNEEKLRTARRMSHVFVIDAPDYPRPLFVTDAAINIYPTLEDKVDIVQNAIDLAHALGLELPKVAILSAVETVTSKIKSTIDAAALCKMADRGQITGGILDGPLAFDNAVSEEAARPRASSRRSPAGPTSSWCPISKPATCWRSSSNIWPRRRSPASCSGARVPIILTSRADKTLATARLMRDRAAAGAPQGGSEALSDAILVLNAGSSSIKFSLFPGEQRPTRQDLFCEGECEGLGHRVHFTAKDGAGAPLARRVSRRGRNPRRCACSAAALDRRSLPAAPSDRGGASRRAWRSTLYRDRYASTLKSSRN